MDRGVTPFSLPRSRGGFTVLEMLIVGMLGTLMVTFMSNATRWYARSNQDMHVSSQLDRELKIASEAIAQDFGVALAVQTTDGTDLQLDVDNGDAVAQWGAPDTVIQYTVQGGVLLRQNVGAGTQVPMARNITSLSAETVTGSLKVHLVAGYRQTEHDLMLQLQDP